MDLQPTDEQRQLRDSLRRMFDRRLATLVDQLPGPPRDDPRRVLADAVAVGLPALGVPEALGGAGGFADLAVAHEELGRGLAPSLLTTVTSAIRLVLHAGAGDERAALLADLMTGRLLAAPALDDDAEPAGSVTARRDGGVVLLDGRRRHVVDGAEVDELLVAAAEPSSGSTLLVRVPGNAAGLDWVEERGGADIAQWTVRLQAVAVPADRLVTADAAAALARYRAEAAVLAAARMAGGGRAVLDRTVDHVRTREQFDRPIGTFQAVQHQLADVATELDATDLAVAQAAWAVDVARPDVARLAATAALAARAAFRRATLVAHQLHGGMGFVLDHPLHLWSARAVADPTAPTATRDLLDALAAASGITATGLVVPPDHRAAVG